MKKRWLFAACLILSLFSLSAQERLAVFFVEKDTAAKLPCISIDFFSSIPNGELYGSIGQHFDPKYKAIGHLLFDGKAKEALSSEAGIGYFGVDNVVVLPHYRNFLTTVIGGYKSQWLNNDSLYVLQEKVWCYNVLDELGFIVRTAADQQLAFKNAREQFSFRYGLTAYPDSTPDAPMTILSKASQVYFNRMNSVSTTEKPDSVRFTDSTIVYRQPIEMHTITAHYHDIPISALEPFSAALKEAIYLYIRDYRIPPERVEFSKSLDNPATYILTFSAVNGSPRYVMRVRVGEGMR